MTRNDAATELALQFATLSEHLHRHGETRDALDALIALAIASVPYCDWAAITEGPEDKPPRSLTSSDGLALAVDKIQYYLGEGPCLTAAAQTEPVVVNDLATEARWPAFCAAVIDQTPVRSLLSLRVADYPPHRALNLYSGSSGVFDHAAVSAAVLFAAHAKVLLLQMASESKAANLAEALTTSRVIGAAVGILMSSEKITNEAAFDRLREASQRLHLKLREVAVYVADTGELPV